MLVLCTTLASGGRRPIAGLPRKAATASVKTILDNSVGGMSRASMTSRLSSCNFGSSVSRSSKQYTRSRRPSRMPEMIPAGSSDEVMTPISSASSRRAAASGVSPRRTPPPGKCHPTRYEERTSNNAGPTYTATKVPSCRGHASRHQMRAIGKPRRKAVRQAKSRSEESKVRSTTWPSRRLYIGSPLGEVNVELARRGF